MLHIFSPKKPCFQLWFSTRSLKRQVIWRPTFKYMEFYRESNFSKVLIMGFEMFYIFRENEDLRKLTVCSVFKRKKKQPPRVLLKNINPHQHIFCILTMSYYFFIQKLTQIFELLYQKKTRRVKATEEPEQNSTYVCSTCASKVSWHRGSAQDACHMSVLGCQVLTQRLAFQLQPQRPPRIGQHLWLSWGAWTAWAPLHRTR